MDVKNSKVFIDHIDHDLTNNRKSNLRACTCRENTMNKNLAINNKSGKTGVCKESTGKWCAYITENNKNIKLGRFNDFESAYKARIEAEIKIFGEFQNTLQLKEK